MLSQGHSTLTVTSSLVCLLRPYLISPFLLLGGPFDGLLKFHLMCRHVSCWVMSWSFIKIFHTCFHVMIIMSLHSSCHVDHSLFVWMKLIMFDRFDSFSNSQHVTTFCTASTNFFNFTLIDKFLVTPIIRIITTSES